MHTLNASHYMFEKWCLYSYQRFIRDAHGQCWFNESSVLAYIIISAQMELSKRKLIQINKYFPCIDFQKCTPFLLPLNSYNVFLSPIAFWIVVKWKENKKKYGILWLSLKGIEVQFSNQSSISYENKIRSQYISKVIENCRVFRVKFEKKKNDDFKNIIDHGSMQIFEYFVLYGK